MIIDREAYVKKLKELAKGNSEYAVFNKRIVNTKMNMIGVRLPDMRKLAKEISKGMDKEAVFEFLKEADKNSYEEVIMAGLVIDYAKVTDEERIELTREYLKYADSWAQIDTFAGKLKNPDEKLWWDFAVECLQSEAEFTARYGVIRLMETFLTEGYIPKVFKALRKVKNDGYYVKMGMAWLYAEASLRDFETTMAEMDQQAIDPWTRRKALQKMLESFRLTEEQKILIRQKRAADKE